MTPSVVSKVSLVQVGRCQEDCRESELFRLVNYHRVHSCVWFGASSVVEVQWWSHDQWGWLDVSRGRFCWPLSGSWGMSRCVSSWEADSGSGT